MKAFIAFIAFFLTLVAALPQDPATSNMLAPVSADESGSNVDFATAMDAAADNAAWNVSASDGSVDISFYKDKNPDSNMVIDPHTCKGQSEIATMKWRYTCKGPWVLLHAHCYTRAPSESRCCPLYKSSSCEHFWPKAGE
jgi:hypothetical protein